MQKREKSLVKKLKIPQNIKVVYLKLLKIQR